jgi:hypothetical protein
MKIQVHKHLMIESSQENFKFHRTEHHRIWKKNKILGYVSFCPVESTHTNAVPHFYWIKSLLGQNAYP